MMSPAMIGLLQRLPKWPRPFEPGEKEKWLAAFEAVLKLDYPAIPPPPQPPVDNAFVAEGCEKFSPAEGVKP